MADRFSFSDRLDSRSQRLGFGMKFLSLKSILMICFGAVFSSGVASAALIDSSCKSAFVRFQTRFSFESFKEKFLGSDAMMVVYITLFLGWIMSFFVSLILGLMARVINRGDVRAMGEDNI